MPKTGFTHEFELATRNEFTKVEAKLTLEVNGRELPTMEVLGKSTEEAVQAIRTAIKKSYEVVPARV